MREIATALLEALDAGRPAAYCRLVETQGSTPQKAGAAMLVLADGSQAGTLGGGRVEAEVKRHALDALQRRAPAILSFRLDDESFQEDGLICGGRMQVVIEPILDREAGQYFRCLEPLTRHGAGATEAIVFDAKASGLDAPASYLFDNQLRLAASLHAGSSAQDAPAIVRRSLRPPASRPQPWAVNGVAYLPLLPRCRLIIVGGGHVGKAVADLAAGLEFDVWVVDDRPEYASQQRFPEAQRRIAGKIADVLPDIEITPETYCLIVTRGHRYDEEALHQLAGRGAAYVGMIGSRRKTQLVFENLVRKGVRREALAEVHAPVGIDIGSQTPAEIAISIWAELIARRNLPGK